MGDDRITWEQLVAALNAERAEWEENLNNRFDGIDKQIVSLHTLVQAQHEQTQKYIDALLVNANNEHKAIRVECDQKIKNELGSIRIQLTLVGGGVVLGIIGLVFDMARGGFLR